MVMCPTRHLIRRGRGQSPHPTDSLTNSCPEREALRFHFSRGRSDQRTREGREVTLHCYRVAFDQRSGSIFPLRIIALLILLVIQRNLLTEDIGYYDYLGTRAKNSHRQIIVTG